MKKTWTDIEYTYQVKPNYCSSFELVPKFELGERNDLKKDIYDVNAVGIKDKNGEDCLQLRTRYYFFSFKNLEDFLYCYYESLVYVKPNINPFGMDLNFIKHILELHDNFAIDCLKNKSIDSTKFYGFENTTFKKLDYEKHSQILYNWMNGV